MRRNSSSSGSDDDDNAVGHEDGGDNKTLGSAFIEQERSTFTVLPNGAMSRKRTRNEEDEDGNGDEGIGSYTRMKRHGCELC